MFRMNRLSSKIMLLSLTPLVLFLVFFIAVVMPSVQKHFLELKIRGLESIIDTATGSMSALDHQVTEGRMSREQAQTLGKEVLRSIRFEGKNYVWAQTSTPQGPRFEVHPIHPEWDGKPVDELGDKHLPDLLRRLEATTEHSTRGLLYYDFGKPGQPGLFPKVSIMQRFDAWGWRLGAGVYLDDVRREAWMMSMTFLVLMGVLAVLMVLASRWLSGRMTKPLHALVEGLRHSDLSRHLEIDTQDEIGDAANAFNTYNDGLRRTVLEIKAFSERVASQSMQLASTAEEMSRTVQDIAHSGEEMLVTGRESSATMRDLAREIETVTGETQKTVDLTREAVDQTAQGAESGRSTSRDMEKIREATAKISNAVMLIQEIANQTNLLSLNAAIEAAKAREHGRGFSVVAEEVRKLADRSRASAEEIQKLLSDTHSVVEGGVQSVESTLEALHGIRDRIGHVASAVMTIGSRSKEQAQSSASTAQQVDHTTQQIESSASATHELSSTVGEVARTAEELASVADGLQKAVAGFKL